MTAKNLAQAQDSTGVLEKANPLPRILVVDDEPHSRQLCADALIYSGYQVETAEDGAAAWDWLQNNNYDLLVTDNSMCRLTGIGLIKKLRAARMALPVIMVSGTMPTDEWNRNPWLRIHAALLKPFTVDELVGTVSEVLRVTESARQPIAPPPNCPSAGSGPFATVSSAAPVRQRGKSLNA